MVGFLHALAPHPPPDALVRPLEPRLWRSVPARAPYERVRELGARYQLVLSDEWGYPASGWNGRGPPWRALDAWARVVRRTARTLRDRAVEWDVWNEPDNPAFWSGTREQFFRVYDVAYRALVEVLGNRVELGGPSTTRPLRAWLDGLLGYCRRAGCRVRFLSYHENLQPYERIPELSRRLREVRGRVLPRYRDVGLARVQVNESVGPADQYRPGPILGFLHHLEAGGAEAAARSCWPDSTGADNCSNGTLEGILTAAGQPRSAWWAYRSYAAGVEARVPSRSGSADVAAIADSRLAEGGKAHVLLARLDRLDARARPRPLELELTLTGLGGALGEHATVEVALLPDTGEAPLPQPRLVSRERLAGGAGETSVRVGGLRPNEALIVAIKP